MQCEACDLAARDPRRADMRNGCDSCVGRALATTAAREDPCDGPLAKLFGDRIETGRKWLAHWRRVLVEVRS